VKPRPFISYAHEDTEIATRLYEDLRRLGAEPWLDKIDLIGGQDWQEAIRRAVQECSHFLALLSSHSVNKRGFVQKELRQAISVLEEFPPGEIFIIPVRLEAAQPTHEALRKLHWVDLFPSYDAGLRQLARSMGLADPSGGESGGKHRPRASLIAIFIVTAVAALASIIRLPVVPGAQPVTTDFSTSTTTRTEAAPPPTPPSDVNPLRTFKWGRAVPASSKTATSERQVALLLGHYDRPSGNANVKKGITEEQYLAGLAPLVAQNLTKRGIAVSILQQSQQVLASLQDSEHQFPMVIALHVNGAPSNTSGTETYVSAHADAQTKQFAQRLHDSVLGVLDTADRSVKNLENSSVIRRLPRAVHIEMFFLTNDYDCEVGVRKRDALAAKLAEVVAEEWPKTRESGRLTSR
jgi:N-acetylmuramoyl-L-alanine amidase